MKRILKYWIKRRDNPQLGVYYVPMGQMTRTAAMEHENTRYGDNIMLEYDTQERYKQRIEYLKTIHAKIIIT